MYLGSAVNRTWSSITLDRELTFRDHIEKSCYTAPKTLSFIKRVSTEFNLITPLKALCCALVRSILKYSVVIWEFESYPAMVQRTFLIMLLGYCCTLTTDLMIII